MRAIPTQLSSATVYVRLIPQLEESNPGFRQTLVRTALTLSADRELLETLADEAFARALVRTVEQGLVFSRKSFWFYTEPAALGFEADFLKLVPDTAILF